MYLEFKFEIVVKKTVWVKTTHKNGSNRCMKKTFFFIFHLPRPNWTCLSVSDIVPVNFIENHWSLVPMAFSNLESLNSFFFIFVLFNINASCLQLPIYFSYLLECRLLLILIIIMFWHIRAHHIIYNQIYRVLCTSFFSSI